MPIKRISIQAILFSIVVVVTTTLYVFYTRWGADVGYDSYYYLRGAEGILAGKGLGWVGSDGSFVPLTHFPPLYPSSLAIAAAILGGNYLSAARVLVVVHAALLAGLTAAFSYKITRSWLAAGLAAVLTMIFKPMVSVMIAGMSEGLYFVLFAAHLWSAVNWFDRHKTRDLILTAVCLAGMLLTRYAAVSVLLSFGLTVLWLDRGNIGRRIKEYVLAVAIAILPGLVWLVQNFLSSGSSTNRTVVYHPMGRKVLSTALESIKLWFIPGEAGLYWRYATVLLIILVFLLALFIVIRNWRGIRAIVLEQPAGIAYTLLTMFMVVYPVFLWISYTWLDASTRWNNRILSPWLFAASLMGIFLIHRMCNFPRGGVLLKVIAGTAMMIIVIHVSTNASYLWRLYDKGEGFTAKAYQESDLLALIREYPDQIPIYTNKVPLVFFNTGMESTTIPEMKNTISDTAITDYPQKMKTMREDITQHGGVLVLFKPYTELGNVYPALEELIEGLTLEYKSPGGNIYR